MPKLTEAEMRKYRSSLYGVAALGQIPRVHLGRDKYVSHGAGNQGEAPPIKWTPQAREAARRAFVTGAISCSCVLSKSM